MGEALATNNKLEVLIMRENKIKWVHYCNFWNLILTNTTLLKMNLQKTDLSDRVVEKMGKYLDQVFEFKWKQNQGRRPQRSR